VSVGLSALFFSPLKPHGQIATLMWVAMLGAAATTLVLIPAFAPRSGVRDEEDPPGVEGVGVC
jgi:hypothetical protein